MLELDKTQLPEDRKNFNIQHEQTVFHNSKT